MNDNLKRITDLRVEKNAINEEMDKLAILLSEQEAPYKIDQIIDICGYSHHGKKGIVTDCTFIINKHDIDFSVRVSVLRKDNSVSNFKAHWGSRHDPIIQAKLKELITSLS